MWWKKKETVPVPEPPKLPNVCLEVLDKVGDTRAIYCRTSSVSQGGMLTLTDSDGHVVAQYASGFWKRTIVLEPKPTAKSNVAAAGGKEKGEER